MFKTLLLLLFASCVGKTSNTSETLKISNQLDSSDYVKSDTAKITFDTTLSIFRDSSYKLTLHVFDINSYNQEKNNSTLTYSRMQADSVERIFQDSFYCMYPDISFKDFNNDNIKDVLVFYYTGGRANPTYHLYLVDTIKNALTYIKGFEDLPNPDLDSINNIITSVALAGQENIWSFYQIKPPNKLTNLGHGFMEDLGDSIKYKKAIKSIIAGKIN